MGDCDRCEMNKKKLMELLKLKPFHWLIIGIILYTLLFTYFGTVRHLSSYYGDPDTSINDQSMYTALKYGMPLFNTFEKCSHFGVHTSPLFYLLLPFYAIYPGTPVFIFLESFAIALGALPLYLLVRMKMGEEKALLFALLYLLYHPLHGVNYDQTNEMCFSICPLLFALYLFFSRRFALFWIAMIIFLSCKEDAAFVAIFWGLYGAVLYFLEKRQSLPLLIHSILMILIGFVYLYVALYIVIPHYHPEHLVVNFHFRYRHLGFTMHEVIRTIITKPLYIISFLLQKEKILYILELLVPLAFLPLLSPALLWMTLPSFGINLLSTCPQMYNTGGRYSAYIIPFLFVAAVFSYEKLVNRQKPEQRERFGSRLMRTMLVLTILSTLFLDQSPLRIGFFVPPITPHQMKILALVKTIPPEASISTQVDILKHVCHRVHAYSGYHKGSEYIFVDERSLWYSQHAQWDKILPAILATGDYEKIYDDEGIKIFRRCTSSTTE